MNQLSKPVLGVVLALSSILCVYLIWLNHRPVSETPSPPPSEDQPAINAALPPEGIEMPPGETDGGYLPVGKIVITPERTEYQDEQLTLHIPAINVTYFVYNGTDSASLRKGVGLYDYAQLPGEKNGNVSIAGHRNSVYNGVINDQAPFYYIDILKDGDYIYLYDEAFIYRYLWQYCEIVEADNWDPIRTSGYSCVTLTSCHPIGVSDHRIIVRGILDEVIPYSADYAFPASAGG